MLLFSGSVAVIVMVLLASLASAQSDPNRFNRLMKPPAERNAPPPIDGIHDGDNEGTYLLQTPLEAFENLPKSKSGNYVSWNKAIDEGGIAPRNSLGDQNMPPIVLDLNIVREVKGSMPDVVYPHKQHTQWLDCANCHPAIFIPQKGANQISMASILLGEKCGVCHGKVAFPVSECRRCHSRPKQQASAN
jgi:c(7)-type cytochrome triheme protein